MQLCHKLQIFLTNTFSQFPWSISIVDWQQNQYFLGNNETHWFPEPLIISIHSADAGKDLLNLNGLRFLEKVLEGKADISGNIFLLTHLKHFVKLTLNPYQLLKAQITNLPFQNLHRAKKNVSSHYDMPQHLLELYLDSRYMAYSCAIFENTDIDVNEFPELIQKGKGKSDQFDSLEKAQWRKFKDAVDYINPEAGDTLLDVGCGYGGQLRVALENHPFSKVVGWTHSHNQKLKGQAFMSHFDTKKWLLNEGDYRQEKNVFNHITSTGMVSHVGVRGLVPYVKNIRKRIKTGGRYVHHSLMTCYYNTPLDAQVGIAFNKKYIWPGFHWFTLAEHIKALEENGFQIEKVLNLKTHYAKTLCAWYLRLMENKQIMIDAVGEPTFRAWQIYLGGGAGEASGDVNRIYCVAK